jgi:hypothetical protein
MNNTPRRATFTVGVVAGGLLAAALLPTAVACADEYDFSPDTTTFAVTQVEGYPPLFNEITGTEAWNATDVTSQGTYESDVLQGTDTTTTFGSFTNDDFVATGESDSSFIFNYYGADSFTVHGDVQIDLANFGGGFENEWIDLPSGSTDPGVSDLLITPFGDFTLAGSAFSDLSTVITEELSAI